MKSEREALITMQVGNMTATMNTLAQKLEAYKNLDAVELFTLLDQTREELDLLALVGAGVHQGRADVMNEAYANITFLRLEKAGMSAEMLKSEREDLRVDQQSLDDWLQDETYLTELCLLFEVAPAFPHESVLKNALKMAVQNRGTSIDDFRTSVGHLYQRLYGEDYKNEELPIAIRGINGSVNVELIEYSRMPDQYREGIRLMALHQHGYSLDKSSMDKLEHHAMHGNQVIRLMEHITNAAREDFVKSQIEFQQLMTRLSPVCELIEPINTTILRKSNN